MRTRQSEAGLCRLAQGIELVARAIRSGIFNDLGSGSNVDLCIITKGKVGPCLALWVLLRRTCT